LNGLGGLAVPARDRHPGSGHDADDDRAGAGAHQKIAPSR
jgi:hypothetical protein